MKYLYDFTNRVLWGDCLRVMKQMPSASVDLVLTDPPYLVNYTSRDGRSVINDDRNFWLQPAFAEIYRVLKADSFCACFYGWNKAEQFLQAWKAAGFVPVSHFVWAKRYASKTGFAQARHEMAYLLAKGQPAKPRYPPSDVFYNWRYTGNRLHPTQKPIEALLPLIRSYSKTGDVVLDPFAGSGTTAVAAKMIGRKFVGIEIDRKHYRTAHRRLRESGRR